MHAGAHTLGVARCSSFKDRIAAANSKDVAESSFAKTLSKTCRAGDNAEQAFDSSRNDFDNDYFNALLRRNGLLTSDHALYAWGRTRPIVAAYAQNQAMFFFDFQQAMRKMSLLALKDDSDGEVRSNCRVIN